MRVQLCFNQCQFGFVIFLFQFFFQFPFVEPGDESLDDEGDHA
jgi:hypothetical protein